jgi:putative transposase
LLCLKVRKNTTYRTLLDELIEMPRIRRAINLEELPSPSTLCKAFSRLDTGYERIPATFRENMDYGAFMNRRLHGWGFAKMHAQIRYKTAANGIRVETVNPAYTSKTYHCCGARGYRPEQATFRCTTTACWVSDYQADVNATLTIADRYLENRIFSTSTRISDSLDLSRESFPREHTDTDDSAEDGEPLTTPQDSQDDADTQQMTLGTYAS